ncbi:protein spaetzle-like [Daphnia carinata]|uniref:protein spaetzle-like n=1 Tax=Daphnia carinata TaxID=120202 RepID=UPI00258020CA|nr:protein spaetzle-like [Daphnia carinata]
MSLFFHYLVLLGLGVVMGNNYKAPYHQPKYEPKYGPEIPACSKNTSKNWCLEDSEYPAYEVVYELDKHYEAVFALYKNVVAETSNSVDTLSKLEEETYLCPSETSYVQPLRAVNTKGKWRVIINKVESYGIKYDQHARIEECEDDAAGKACPLVPTCYESKCLQKSIYHRFLVYDPTDYYFPFAIETFKLPASCACFVGAFKL